MLIRTSYLAQRAATVAGWLEPERAHAVAIQAARLGLAGQRGPDDPRLVTRLAGHILANPIGLAAGFDKNAVALRGLAAAGFGFLEAGTVTMRPQPGNSRPRLFRLREDAAVINRLGFNNAGIETFRRNVRAAGASVPVGANIGLNKEGGDPERDYPALVAAVGDHAAYVAINVSSPNTPGLRDLQTPQNLARILQAIHRTASPPPLFVKLAPDLDDAALPDIVAACIDSGAAGLIVSNTTIARPATLRSRHADESGGLSGAPLKQRSTEMLRLVATLARGRLALIGVGGVASGADVLEKLRAGASAVQLYTALALQGPALLPRIKRELLQELDRAGLADVEAAIGKRAVACHLTGLADIAGGYDGFIVDLWGVVHDGTQPYPGAIDCLARLRETGAPVLLLSNAPRRSHAAAAGLAAMGIGPDLYSDLLTSGEATWEALAEARGLRVHHLGPERDRSIVDDRDVRLVEDPREAQLLLNTGPDDLRDPTRIDPYLHDLQACLDAGLPMLCANPDLEVLRGTTRVVCAGALAQWYEQQGGAVRWIGKPFPEIYDTALRRLGRPAGALLAIGDSLRTDIAGAAAAGIASCWVLGGIHAHATSDAAEREAGAAGLAPVATIPSLRW